MAVASPRRTGWEYRGEGESRQRLHVVRVPLRAGVMLKVGLAAQALPMRLFANGGGAKQLSHRGSYPESTNADHAITSELSHPL
jgi:hypothetical protein